MGAAPSINDISEKEFELFKHLKHEYEQKVKELNASEAQAGAEVTHPGSWLQAGNQQVIDDLTAKLRATEAELQIERAGGSGRGGDGDGVGGVPAPPRASSPQWNESDTYVLSVTRQHYHYHTAASWAWSSTPPPVLRPHMHMHRPNVATASMDPIDAPLATTSIDPPLSPFRAADPVLTASLAYSPFIARIDPHRTPRVRPPPAGDDTN